MKITEQQFLKDELELMNLTIDNPEFVALAQEVCDYISQYHPKSVIDFGCGTGVYSEVLRRNGINVFAQDIFKSHRDYCRQNYPELKIIATPKEAELMLFIEVAEHMTNEEIKLAIFKISPEFILFSSTPETDENDEQWGHINIKQEEEWISFWEELGYKWIHKPKTPTLWALMLKRKI